MADWSFYQLALFQLISNAIKFTKPVGLDDDIKIQFSLRHVKLEEWELETQVIDQG